MATIILILLIALILLAPHNRLQVLIAFDQLVNARLGGYADETFSARCWREQHKPKYKYLVAIIDGIFFWQPAHCYQAYISERLRRQLPESYGIFQEKADNGDAASGSTSL